ncbi:MAG: hypothetical protein A3E81_02225 [Gammaproteobacteria bacterium RIFCSPHIGHO2_12_FULL_36_30]|nr:MAG: hypothetical protein A3E81_02225 [Gammaproteobacteria bacterium RIFCSPHIGHO2_12_FULL_36_30]
MSTKAQQFFFQHPIFSFKQFVRAMQHSENTCSVMLNHHLKTGNIVRIKQSLYAAIPSGANPQKFSIDPYSIISNLCNDALIAYHTALQFHGLAYSFHFQHIFQTTKEIRSFQFRQDRFKVTQFSKFLPKSKYFIFSEKIDHHGFLIRVTNIERTIVDTLDRINLSGGLEEVWRSLQNIQSANVKNIIDYAILLKNSTTIAKVGLYLRLHQKQWAISEKYFEKLKKYLPQSVHYLDRNHRINGKFIKEWHIVVPNELMNEQWEEILDMSDI